MGTAAPRARLGEVRTLEASSQDFDDHARLLTRRHGQIAALLLAVFPIAWIPFDAAFFVREGALPDGYYWARIAMSGTAALSFLLIRTCRPARVNWVLIAMLPVVAGLLGIQFGLIGDLALVFFATGYFMPFLTVALLVRFPARLGATALVVFSYLGGFFATAPELLHDAGIVRQVTLLMFGAIISLVLGHAFLYLLRENHAQRWALAQHAHDLKELGRLKNDFFANISHELRTPLTLILGSLRELRTPTEGEARRDVIGTGERNAARLLELIEDLLELARFESGRGASSRRSIDLARLVREVASNFRPSSPSQGTLRLSGCDGVIAADVDPRQLRTALYNLLGNAFKFTPSEGRRVEVELERDGERILLRVRDNGPGISVSVRERVFDRFYRGDTGAAGAQRGTGIGLALVSDIARAHGAEVALETEEGRGSTFTLTLPVGDPSELSRVETPENARTSPRPSTPALRVDSAGPDAATVLVAEDDPDLRAYLVRLLSARYRVVSARDGNEAAAAAEREEPALLVTDVTMPGKGGYELVRGLRSQARLSRLPVVFLTARVDAPARDEAYIAGADDFLTKPFDEDELLARVGNLLRLRSSERGLAAANETLERRVAERTARLRELALHLQRSREDERQHLARELHDETGQLLTALRMALDQTRRKNDDASIAPLIDRMSEILDQAFDVTRHLVSELRPRVLDDLGLGAAASWYLERFEEHAPLRCCWSVEPAELRTSPEAATAVFRTMQEALTNAARHSHATEVVVRVEETDDALTLCVEDDGEGFDPALVTEGFGLLGMRERAEAIGGVLTIESHPGEGTRLSLSLPARPEEAAA